MSTSKLTKLTLEISRDEVESSLLFNTAALSAIGCTQLKTTS